MNINNKDLRIHLKRFIPRPEEVECLEITTESLRVLDEEEFLVVTDNFKENDDLSKLKSIQVLALFGQPISGEIVLSDTIQEILVKDCGPLQIKVGGLVLKVPSSKMLWYWKKGASQTHQAGGMCGRGALED